MPNRRQLLGAAGALAVPALNAQGMLPGKVLILRHMATEPGIGDPPGYRLDDCSTQRNLSVEGRRQAHAIGQRLATSGWRPSALLTSQWCRCRDSAIGIADGLGPPAPALSALDALDSYFDQRSRGARQTAALRSRVTALANARGFELWVTHQVNMTDLTGRVVAMGEGVWLIPGPQGPVPVESFPA
jgi:broad specificity phosphatase PhoE